MGETMIRDGVIIGLAFFGFIGIYTFMMLTVRAWHRYRVVTRRQGTTAQRLNAWHGFCAQSQHLIIEACITGAIMIGLLVMREDRTPALQLALVVLCFSAWGLTILYGLQENRYQHEMWATLGDPERNGIAHAGSREQEVQDSNDADARTDNDPHS